MKNFIKSYEQFANGQFQNCVCLESWFDGDLIRAIKSAKGEGRFYVRNPDHSKTIPLMIVRELLEAVFDSMGNYVTRDVRNFFIEKFKSRSDIYLLGFTKPATRYSDPPCIFLEINGTGGTCLYYPSNKSAGEKIVMFTKVYDKLKKTFDDLEKLGFEKIEEGHDTIFMRR